MSRNQWWFKAKEWGGIKAKEGGGMVMQQGEDRNAIPNKPEQKFVTWNSLIVLQCVHGPKNNSKTTVEYY